MKQYTIHQLDLRTAQNERPYDYEFMNWLYAKKNGFDFKHYHSVYTAPVPTEWIDRDDKVLDGYLWEKFNLDHPKDYTGHSLSTSDIVQLDDKYFYCDSCGWVDVTEYVTKKN